MKRKSDKLKLKLALVERKIRKREKDAECFKDTQKLHNERKRILNSIEELNKKFADKQF